EGSALLLEELLSRRQLHFSGDFREVLEAPLITSAGNIHFHGRGKGRTDFLSYQIIRASLTERDAQIRLVREIVTPTETPDFDSLLHADVESLHRNYVLTSAARRSDQWAD